MSYTSDDPVTAAEDALSDAKSSRRWVVWAYVWRVLFGIFALGVFVGGILFGVWGKHHGIDTGGAAAGIVFVGVVICGIAVSIWFTTDRYHDLVLWRPDPHPSVKDAKRKLRDVRRSEAKRAAREQDERLNQALLDVQTWNPPTRVDDQSH